MRVKVAYNPPQTVVPRARSQAPGAWCTGFAVFVFTGKRYMKVVTIAA